MGVTWCIHRRIFPQDSFSFNEIFENLYAYYVMICQLISWFKKVGLQNFTGKGRCLDTNSRHFSNKQLDFYSFICLGSARRSFFYHIKFLMKLLINTRKHLLRFEHHSIWVQNTILDNIRTNNYVHDNTSAWNLAYEVPIDFSEQLIHTFFVDGFYSHFRFEIFEIFKIFVWPNLILNRYLTFVTK